jgi:hypothetical protein
VSHVQKHKEAQPTGQPTEDELRDAALQFVRKISGYREPSKANRDAFDGAVAEIAEASRKLFDGLVVRAPASVG